MLLQLQQQQQWQYESQFQTYESFSQILYDVPHGPVYASVIIATIPFLLYFLWKKSYLRTLIITPAVTLFSRIWYLWEERKLENRVSEEYEGIAGRKMELKDITRIENRWYPKQLIFKDMLKKGKGTEFIIDAIQFDVTIPKYIFSKASLRR